MSFRLVSLTGAALLLAACSTDSSVGPARAEITPASLSIADPGLIRDGDVVQLIAQARNAAGQPINGVTIQWAVVDPSVAVITATGLLTALREGSTEVVATSGAGSSTVQRRRLLNIVLHPATAIEVNRTTLEVPLFTQGGVTVTLRGLDGRVLLNRPLQWSSDDPTIARVSETGVITPVRGGTTTIRVRYGTLAAAVQVTVPTPAPSYAEFDVTHVDGRPLPAVIDDQVEIWEDGRPRRVVTKLLGGTVQAGIQYRVVLRLAAYEVTELQGSIGERLLMTNNIGDIGVVDFNAISGDARLTSTRTVNTAHTLRAFDTGPHLSYRDAGASIVWGLGLRPTSAAGR